MKALQDLLGGPPFHQGTGYTQTYVTPGTIDPAFPTEEAIGEKPDTDDAEKHLFNRRGTDDLFRELWYVIHHPDYETAGPYTLGGKSQASLSQIATDTGTGSVYTISNPFDSDAEYTVLSVAFGAAGQAILSRDLAPAIGPALSIFINGNTYTRAIPFFASGVTTIPSGMPLWYPIPASDQLYWGVNMTAANTSSALVTVAFRRRINRHGRYELTQE